MKSQQSSSLWQQPPHPAMIVIPASGEISQGKLLMSSVTAKQAIKRIRNLQYECARMASASIPIGSSTGLAQYGFSFVRLPTPSTVGIGIFQVNWCDSEPYCKELIMLSSHRFKQFCAETNYHTRIELYEEDMRSILTGENIVFVPPKF